MERRKPQHQQSLRLQRLVTKTSMLMFIRTENIYGLIVR